MLTNGSTTVKLTGQTGRTNPGKVDYYRFLPDPSFIVMANSSPIYTVSKSPVI